LSESTRAAEGSSALRSSTNSARWLPMLNKRIDGGASGCGGAA
jgi:hypothetical protein